MHTLSDEEIVRQSLEEVITRNIKYRKRAVSYSNWQSFFRSNLDLVEDALAVLYRYHNKVLLFSDSAQKCWLEPILALLPYFAKRTDSSRLSIDRN